MCKKLLLYLLLCCLVFVLGCAELRRMPVDVSIEEVKNVGAAREVALNYLLVWPAQSGFIKGALGPRIDELPAHVVDAIHGLDELSAADPNELGDYELGLSLGMRVRLLSSVVVEALQFYAPDVLDLIPLLF